MIQLNVPATRERKASSIDAIVLHQTGCKIGSINNWRHVNAHYGVTISGDIVEIHNPTHYVNHANTLNSRSIGVEIEGNFRGLSGSKRTLWQGNMSSKFEETKLSEVQQIAAIDLLTSLCGKYDINFIFAHRQSSDNRIGDPGEEIWRKIASPVIEFEGLSDGWPEYKRERSGGYPLPDQWTGDERGVGYYDNR